MVTELETKSNMNFRAMGIRLHFLPPIAGPLFWDLFL